MIDTLKITTVQRDKVNIDGKEYQLKTADEFSFEYCMKLSEIGKSIQSMNFDKGKDRKRLLRYLDKIVADILIAPWLVRRRLNLKHKFEVVNFFLNRKKERDLAAKNMSLSPDYNTSTVAN